MGNKLSCNTLSCNKSKKLRSTKKFLQDFTNKDIEDFSFNNLERICKIVDIYDADTVRAVFYLNKYDDKPIK